MPGSLRRHGIVPTLESLDARLRDLELRSGTRPSSLRAVPPAPGVTPFHHRPDFFGFDVPHDGSVAVVTGSGIDLTVNEGSQVLVVMTACFQQYNVGAYQANAFLYVDGVVEEGTGPSTAVVPEAVQPADLADPIYNVTQTYLVTADAAGTMTLDMRVSQAGLTAGRCYGLWTPNCALSGIVIG